MFRAAALSITFVVCSAAAAQPPVAARKPVTDVYHGTRVTDDYRWLEDWNDPAVKSWSEEQNSYARRYLDGLPQRPALRQKIADLVSKRSGNFFALRYRGGKLFAIQRQPPKEQPFLVSLSSANELDTARVIVAPDEIDKSGKTSIDFYVPSHDGKHVIVSLSKAGSENGDGYVYESATGKRLSDVIPRVNGGTAGGSVAWNADNSGFWYTRYPRTGERPEADLGFYQQIWFHRLGTDTSKDTYSLGKEFPKIAEIALTSSDDGRHVLATVANGDGGEFAHYLLTPGGEWKQIAGFAGRVIEGTFGQDGFLYLLSRRGAPKGRVLKLSLKDPVLSRAKVIVPETDLSIQGVTAAGDRIYVSGTIGGPSAVRVFTTTGKAEGSVPTEKNSAVYQTIRWQQDKLLFSSASYVHPAAWYEFDPKTSKVSSTGLRSDSSVDFGDIDVAREFVVSKDGTRVPMTILSKKGTRLDGSNPTLLTGYGGYGVSLPPHFNPNLRPLFDRGVVYAIANLRGGGEYGEEWHLAGNLIRKQNVFDDFEACARYLIAHRYTKPARLAIMGGSNGGLLMGAALTQHPELYRAVVSMVGIYDMLRVELSPNGAFNVTEYGTVKEADQFRSLYAYSPYHHVKNGIEYPAVLFTTGANDPRVDPMHSRKMAARLQATGTKWPVLLRTSSTSGHGIGTASSEQIEQTADIYGFLFAQWGLE